MEQMPWVQSASMICSSSFDSLGCAISIYYSCFGFYYMISDLASVCFWQGGRACRRGCVKALPEKQVVRLVAGSVPPCGALAKGGLVHGHISDSSTPRNADRRCPAARVRGFL